MPSNDDYLELAKQWLRRQPVQSPDAGERARDNEQLVVDAYEIVAGLVHDPDIAAVRQVGQNIRALESKVRARDDRMRQAIEIAVRSGGIDGSHHQAWVIDQMVRVLAGDEYDAIVREAKHGDDGPETYGWDTGTAP